MSLEYETSAEFFETKYLQSPDPWNVEHSTYERERYDATLAELSHRRYRRALEPGCSVGVLTAGLAGLSDAVETFDFSPSAVDRARRRCANLSNVEVHCSSLAERMPIVGFDLIVMSGIGYYFTPAAWSVICTNLITCMNSGDTLLAAHWLGTSKDHQMSGDEVHEILSANFSLLLDHAERRECFVSIDGCAFESPYSPHRRSDPGSRRRNTPASLPSLRSVGSASVSTGGRKRRQRCFRLLAGSNQRNCGRDTRHKIEISRCLTFQLNLLETQQTNALQRHRL